MIFYAKIRQMVFRDQLSIIEIARDARVCSTMPKNGREWRMVPS